MKLKMFAAAAAFAFCTAPAMAYENVVQGAHVNLEGEFNIGGWGGTPNVPGSSIVDGAFFPEQHQWDINTVWWDAHRANSAQNSIQIILPDTVRVDRFVMQADNNDKYTVQYLHQDQWITLWTAHETNQWGVTTRNSGLLAPVETHAFRILASDGDGYYSVSEFQAFGAPVPESESWMMLLGGLAGLGVLARKRKQKTANQA